MMMMLMGREAFPTNPTVQVPPWEMLEDPMANIHSSPFPVVESDEEEDEEYGLAVDAYACDHFRMFEFKIRRCARGRSHDWTECPFAHPGEKARRRDPRKVHYSGTPCPEFRKGQCKKGDACEYAHGVFECWLHPSRYRTQPCKDGTQCRRRVCFFAHTPEQLRVLNTGRVVAESYDGSPSRLGHDSVMYAGSGVYSPPCSPPSESPPMSPSGSLGFAVNDYSPRVNSLSELANSFRTMHVGSSGMRMSMSPPGWGYGSGPGSASGFGSPRSPSTLRPGFMSLPATPTRSATRSGLKVFDLWETSCEEEPVMERVESGRELRAKIYAKLSKENSLGRAENTGSGPDVGWVSELVK